MPNNVFGLPTHVLLQHVVVVLLPIAAVGALLVALWAWYRHHLGLATLVATLLVTLCVPLTTQSGESLADRLPDSQAIAAGASWSAVAAHAGRFAYACTFHPTMVATLVVE